MAGIMAVIGAVDCGRQRVGIDESSKHNYVRTSRYPDVMKRSLELWR